MKTYSLLRLIAGFFILAMLFSACGDDDTIPPNDEIPLGDQDLPYWWYNWMSHLPDNSYLTQITIPGTHDSGADKHTSDVGWPYWHYVITHDFTIENQLKLGVRWFDIRLHYHDHGQLTIHHDKYYLNKNFDNVLDWSIDFLNAYPSEIIILMIMQEYSHVSNHDFGEAVLKKIENHGLKHFYLKNKVPTVGEARGKIYIVRNNFVNHTGNDLGVYVNWSSNTAGSMHHYNPCSVYAQDHYSLHTVSTHTKYNEVVNCIKKAHDNTDHNTFYINFVSGERVPDETLWETAVKINYRVEDYLNGHAKNWRHCGIIMINFAGGGDADNPGNRNCAPHLVKAIIHRNPL